MLTYISLGSNIGNRLENLQKAAHLVENRCLSNVRHSIIIETDAIVPDNSPKEWNKPFLNMIIAGETDLSPIELLQELKNIETEMGREIEHAKWAPRIIDLDILIYGSLTLNTKDITIPHKELNNRDFLLHLLSLIRVNMEDQITNHGKYTSFSKSYVLKPKLVGILNATTDSFSDGGKFYNIDNAIKQIIKLAEDGASVIEIGAQSTRPGAVMQKAEDECEKLVEILDAIAPLIQDKKLSISIDTFHPSIALKLIKKYKIEIINDVMGKFDDHSLQTIAENETKFCIMHSLTIPSDKNIALPNDKSPINHLKEWADMSIKRLIKNGFSRENIILDPGIGFGKTAHQDISIIQNIALLREFNCPIMLGHSRKSYIKSFSAENEAEKRDIETIAVSLAVQDKIDFLRIHNVADHMKALVANHIIKIN